MNLDSILVLTTDYTLDPYDRLQILDFLDLTDRYDCKLDFLLKARLLYLLGGVTSK